MSSKRQVRRRECGDKKQYATIADANSAATYATQRIGRKLDAYRCKWCHGYHIGHRTASTWQAIRERPKR